MKKAHQWVPKEIQSHTSLEHQLYMPWMLRRKSCRLMRLDLETHSLQVSQVRYFVLFMNSLVIRQNWFESSEFPWTMPNKPFSRTNLRRKDLGQLCANQSSRKNSGNTTANMFLCYSEALRPCRQSRCKSVRLQKGDCSPKRQVSRRAETSSRAVEIRDTWLNERAHECLRTQSGDVPALRLNSCNSCSSNVLCAKWPSAWPFHSEQFCMEPNGNWKNTKQHHVGTSHVWRTG